MAVRRHSSRRCRKRPRPIPASGSWTKGESMRRLGSPLTHGLAMVFLVLGGTVGTCGAHPVSAPTDHPPSVPAAPRIVAEAPPPSDTYRPTKLLQVEPVKGYVGDAFTVHGDGLPAGKSVEFFWGTVDAMYRTQITPDNVEYHERTYQEKRVSFGSATVD